MVQANDDTPPRHTALLWLARTTLLLWLGFWTWFIVSVMASEGASPWPVGMLCGLWVIAAWSWFWPRTSALALVALAAWSLWFFRPPTGDASAPLWLIAVPACAIAALAWFTAPPPATQR